MLTSPLLSGKMSAMAPLRPKQASVHLASPVFSPLAGAAPLFPFASLFPLSSLSVLAFLAFFLLPPLHQARAESAFEMVPPSRSSLPDPQPADIVKGVPVFASPSPSSSSSSSSITAPATGLSSVLERKEPGEGKVEVRGFAATTPDAPIEPSVVYRASALPRNNEAPATDGHHRTLVGFYAVHPYRESTSPRRLRFEIRLEVPGSLPQDSVIEMYAPADGKIRPIPAHISLPINKLTRPGKYRMSWSVVDQQSGDWDTAFASFVKASVEKVAEVDPSSLPTPSPQARPPSAEGFATTPPPKRPGPAGNFVTTPPTPGKKNTPSDFVTSAPAPSAPRPGESHQGFRTETAPSPTKKKKW